MNEQTVDLMKWLLIGAASGYVPLGCFIYILFCQLIKSKDKSIKIMQEATIHNKETNALLDSVGRSVEKVIEVLGE